MQGELFFIVLGAALAVVLSRWFSAHWTKVSRGARAVHRILRKALPRSEYAVLSDVALRTENGPIRIDQLVVSRFGIFVIEIQEQSGRIIGDERASHWIQSTDDSRVEFRNPLRENRACIEALRALLGLHASRFHSLVVFTGNAEFVKSLPPHVMRTDRLLPYIEVSGSECLVPEDVRQAIETIESSRTRPDEAARPPRAGSLPTGPVPRAAAARFAFPRLRQGLAPRLAAKALAVVGAMTLLLMAGNALMQGLTGLTAAGGGRPPAFPEPKRPAGLQCAFASDTDRCACYDAEGARVTLEFGECKARAEGLAGH